MKCKLTTLWLLSTALVLLGTSFVGASDATAPSVEEPSVAEPASATQEEAETAAPGERTPPELGLRGFVYGGYWDASVDGSPVVMNKYEPIDGDPDLGLGITALEEWGLFSLDGRFRASDDQKAEMNIDVGRWFRNDTEWSRMPVRLPHNSLAHFAAATDHGRVAEHTDYDPEAIYGLDWQLLEHRSELQFQGLPGLTLGFGYRNQERSGVRQATSVSHCSSCHVISQSRPMDETTEDVSVDLAYDFAALRLWGSFKHRTLDEGTQSISLLYDDALHPELRKPVFDDRLQWDSAEGPQEVHQRPDTSKDTFKLGLSVPKVAGFDVGLTGVWSETENELTRYRADYSGYMLDASRQIGKRWRFRWRNRAYALQNDDAVVTVNARTGIAGVAAGKTYPEQYGFPPTVWTRQSTLDRDVFDSHLEFALRMNKKAGRLRFLYDFDMTDRANLEVAPTSTKTTSNVLGVAWSSRPTKRLRLWAKIRYGNVDNPFINLNGAYSTLVSQPGANPWAPTSAQYFESQNARIADVGASPSKWNDLDLRASWAFGGGRTLLTASYKYWDGSNDELDLAQWDRTVDALTVSLFSAVNERLSWNVSYALNGTELNYPNTIPIFDG